MLIAHLCSGDTDLTFDQTLQLHSYFVYVSSEGSGKPIGMHIWDKYQNLVNLLG